MVSRELFDFCHKIDIPDDYLQNGEDWQEIHIELEIPASTLQRLNEEDISTLYNAYKDGLTLKIGPDVFRFLDIEDGVILEEIKSGLERLAKRSEEITFYLAVKKVAFLRCLNFDFKRANGLYFLFRQRLVEFLQAPISQLDVDLFAGGNQACVIILGEAGCDLDYEGKITHVISENNASPARLQVDVSAEDGALADKYRTYASEPPRWAGFDLKNVTPVHFVTKPKANQGEAEVSQLLAENLLHTTILYTANHASQHEKIVAGQAQVSYSATYASSEETVKMQLERGVAPTIADPALEKFASWAFQGKDYDRLTILQNVVAREITGETPQTNYRLFVSNLDHLLSEASWNHRIYLTGKINEHFGQVQELAKLVSETATEVGDKLESVTKGFIEALLAAIGVVVGSLIAALVKSDIQNPVFRFGMYAYGIYLVAAIIFRMVPTLVSYLILKSETDARIQRYKEALEEDKVNDLVAPLRQREWMFWIGYVLVLAFFLALAVVTFMAADNLGEILVREGILPTPTPTP